MQKQQTPVGKNRGLHNIMCIIDTRCVMGIPRRTILTRPLCCGMQTTPPERCCCRSLKTFGTPSNVWLTRRGKPQAVQRNYAAPLRVRSGQQRSRHVQQLAARNACSSVERAAVNFAGMEAKFHQADAVTFGQGVIEADDLPAVS